MPFTPPILRLLHTSRFLGSAQRDPPKIPLARFDFCVGDSMDVPGIGFFMSGSASSWSRYSAASIMPITFFLCGAAGRPGEADFFQSNFGVLICLAIY
ncbi:hypothetical protein KC356_g294 [Hortaea werneckii]|nr:hypothetical protein KC356_g294 [Hortaea werneckii]